VEVGIYLDLRNPAAWRQDPRRLYSFTLELCEEAERLGIDSIWVTEHHMFDDGYLPQPLTFAAAIAARTQRVRIGTAVLLAPLHSAVEVAEQAAIVDLVSGGRLDLGLGAGYRVPEFELFGADLERRYAVTDDRVRELRGMWHGGRLTPTPVQERIPIWLGYNGPQGARRAGRLGEGLLSLSPALLEPYREGLRSAGHDPNTARMSGVYSAWATLDPERDWPTVAKHIAYQMDSYRRYMVEGTDAPVPRPVDVTRVVAREPGRVLGSFGYGTPEQVAAQVEAHVAELPVDTVFFWASVGGMPEEMARTGVEVIGTHLAPLVRRGT